MASNAMDYEPANGDRFEDDQGSRGFDDRARDRSASPRRGDEGRDNDRRRSASPGGAGADRAPREDHGPKGDGEDGAINPGSNLFVTGIHPRLTEGEVARLFEKYGEVEKCQIMRDPHSKESRGFGFVKMVTSDQADAAKDGLQGENIEGRTLSIEKARRARPRTPTPGKYFGPPKREGGPPGRGGRFDDRRRGGGGYGGGYGRDDPYRYRGGGGYDRRDDRDRGYDRGYDRGDRGYDRGDRGYDRRDRDDGPRIDRYASGGRDERGGGRGYDRDRGYERGDRDARPPRDGPAYDSGARGGGEGGGARDYPGDGRPMR